MPQYTWKGIDLSGSQKQGALTIESPAQLKEQLLRDGIALLSFAEKKPHKPWLITRRNTGGQSSLITFFEYLCHLIDSGVPLLTALELVTTQLTDQELCSILNQIIICVKKGDAFSTSLKGYPEKFSPTIIQLISAGEKTGKLAPSLTYLCSYLKDQNTFKKTLVQSSIFPLFTMSFGFIIMIGILVGIIPQFENFFNSTNKTLPPLTQGILNLSAWLRSWNSIIFLAIFIVGIFLLKHLTPKNILSGLFTRIPLLGNIIITTNLINTLRMLSLFLKAGIPLKDALETIAISIKNPHFHKKIQKITNALVAGQSIATQLPTLASSKDAAILNTFITIGEQTGKLDAMLDKATAIFEEKLKNDLDAFSLFFQPTLMIVVGLLIAVLMAAVYLPLFNLAYFCS